MLETGTPYSALEYIHSIDGKVMNVITRMKRTGKPGAYTVTISFDDLTELMSNTAKLPSNEVVAPPAQQPENQNTVASGRETKVRVLIVDEDRRRSATQLAALKNAGFDAVSISDSNETLAFMEAALEMGVTLHKVEISLHMANSLSGEAKVQRHDILMRAIEQKLANQPATRPAAVPAATSKRLPKAPVLSVVASAPAPEEENNKSAEPVDHVASVKSSEQPAEDTPSLANRDRVRVLVAEDNDVNQIVFEQILEGIGADFRIVNNGEEAVAAWRAAAPDLILMDVSMPVMNGLQAVQAIRDAEASEAQKTLRVPVIAVTAHAMNGDRDRCLAAGMDDYLSKPVNPEKLEALIQKWVDNSERFQAAG